MVAGGLRALDQFAPNDDAIPLFLVFRGNRQKGAEYQAQFAPFVFDNTRKPDDKSAGLLALIESWSQRVIRPGIVQIRSEEFGRIEQTLLAVLLPGFLDEIGDVSEIATEIFDLNRWS